MPSRADVEAGRAFVRLYLKNDISAQLVRVLQAAQTKLRNFGTSASMIGRQVGFIGTAVTASFAFAARSFADFDNAMRNVSTMLDNPEQFLPNFRQGIKDMSVEFGKAKADLAAGLFDILSATIPPELAMQRLAAATKLAAAGNAEVAASVSVLNTLMETYGDSFTDAADAADFLFAINKRGRTTLPELAQNLGRIIAVSKAAGTSLEDMGASTALLTRATGGTELALTALQAISATFLKPEAAGAALWAEKFGDELGASTLQAIGMTGVLERLSKLKPGEVAKIFPNIRALRGIFPAIAKMEGFSDDLKAMADRAGNVNTAFEKMKGPLLIWTQLLEQIRNVKLAIGKAITDSILPYKDAFLSAVKAIETFVKNNKKLVVAVAAGAVVLLAAGVALMALGAASTLAAAGIGVLKATITGLVGVLSLSTVGMTVLTTATSLLGFALVVTAAAADALIAVMLAHPITAVAVAALAAAAAFQWLTFQTAELTSAMSDALAKGDQLRAQEQGRLAALAALAGKQKLTNVEMATAAGLIQSLTDTYGDLGLTVNEATRQLEGFAKIQEEVNKLQAEAKQAQLQASFLEEQGNIKELVDAMVANSESFDVPFIGKSNTEIMANQQREIDSRLRNLSALGKAWRAASAEVAFYNREVRGEGDVAPAADPATPEPISDDAVAMNKRLIDEISDYRIQQIEDEEQRSIAAISKRYAVERENAEKLGASLRLVEDARNAALEGVAINVARQRQEQAEWNAGLREDATTRLRDQTRRLEIEMSTTDEKERQRKLIEHERRIALRDTGDTGPDLDAIQKHFDMRLRQLDQSDADVGRRVAPRGIALTATYSAAAARISGFQPGAAGPEAKMVAELAGINKHTAKAAIKLAGIDRIAENTAKQLAATEQFLARWRVN
jgi:TP901 family phage tail tape measure protein